jgi:hypothetical protein
MLRSECDSHCACRQIEQLTIDDKLGELMPDLVTRLRGLQQVVHGARIVGQLIGAKRAEVHAVALPGLFAARRAVESSPAVRSTEAIQRVLKQYQIGVKVRRRRDILGIDDIGGVTPILGNVTARTEHHMRSGDVRRLHQVIGIDAEHASRESHIDAEGIERVRRGHDRRAVRQRHTTDTEAAGALPVVASFQKQLLIVR